MSVAIKIEAGQDRLLKLQEVSAIVGFGRTKIYALVKTGSFPQPFKPAGISTRWSAREIGEWIEKARACAR